MKILQAILTLLTLPVAESLRFQSSSVVSEGRNYLHASKVLQVTLSFKDASRSAALRPSALWHSKGEASDDPYLQHVCPSCSYIYDESKGFKKRHPPGTRLKDIPVFMCPVCGAAKDQFEVVPPSE